MFSTQWLLRHMIRAYEDLNRIYIFGKSRLDMWKYPVHQCTSVGAGKNSLASTCALSAGCTIRQVHTPAIHDCKPWRLIATPSVQSFTAETFLCCFRLCSFFSEVLRVRNSSFPSRVTDSVCEMFCWSIGQWQDYLSWKKQAVLDCHLVDYWFSSWVQRIANFVSTIDQFHVKLQLSSFVAPNVCRL